MCVENSYKNLLEECIKNELLPVYNRYFQEKNIDPPSLTIDLFRVIDKKTPALFKSWPLVTPGVLAFTPDRRVAKKQKNSP